MNNLSIYENIENLLKKFDNDQYSVISHIIKNYKDYKYNDSDECRSNLIMIFEDYYDYTIDYVKLSSFLRENEISIDRTDQEKFRKKLIKKYEKCIITGNHPDECESAHIIPLSIKHSFDVNNGLLLSSSLHKTFDKYIWSIDKNGKIIVKDTNNKYLIEKYKGKKLFLDNDTMNNLKYHYECFIEKK